MGENSGDAFWSFAKPDIEADFIETTDISKEEDQGVQGNLLSGVRALAFFDDPAEKGRGGFRLHGFACFFGIEAVAGDPAAIALPGTPGEPPPHPGGVGGIAHPLRKAAPIYSLLLADRQPTKVPGNGFAPLFELPGLPCFFFVENLLLPKTNGGFTGRGKAQAEAEILKPSQDHEKAVFLPGVEIPGGFEVLTPAGPLPWKSVHKNNK